MELEDGQDVDGLNECQVVGDMVLKNVIVLRPRIPIPFILHYLQLFDCCAGLPASLLGVLGHVGQERLDSGAAS